MRWLDSRTPSPPAATATRKVWPAALARVNYIPPLVDGASGTMPRAHRQIDACTQIRRDAGSLGWVLPSLVRACLPRYFPARGVALEPLLTWRDVVDAALHLMLTLLELYMLLFAAPLFLVLPGLAFLGWLATCAAGAWILIHMLNPNTRAGVDVVLHNTNTAHVNPHHDSHDDRWFFVAGMGATTRHLTHTTLPLLSRIFNRPVMAMHSPTLGLPLDLIALLLERSKLVSPRAPARVLYQSLRAALLDATLHRVVVLAHNVGASTTASVVADLFSDLPESKLAKLEVYTFGAAAAELVVPLASSFQQQQQHGPHRAPHLEHFAFADDPFARFGLLPAVRDHLDGRMCGGLFIVDPPATAPTPSPRGLVVEDYLSALFASGGVLDGILRVDFETAEKRELAAIAHYRGHQTLTTRRPSWTWLGATAGIPGHHDLAVMDGLRGLAAARDGCKLCDGHRGRDLSRLAGYVCDWEWK